MSEYYLSNGAEAVGPYSAQALIDMGVEAETAIRKDGEEAWIYAADEPEIATALESAAKSRQEAGEGSDRTSRAAMHWGPFKDDGIVGPGLRKYSSILWDIPNGKDWGEACYSHPATIKGHYFARPTKCVHTGFNMWGEWHVPDATGVKDFNAIAFLYPEIPINLGHVGWGFKLSDGRWCYGSTETKGWPIIPGMDNGAFVEVGSKEEMLRAFRDGVRKGGKGQNWRYKSMKLCYAPNPSPDRGQFEAEVVKNLGYAVVGNNCMDHVVRILNGYAGIPIVPFPSISGPVAWVPRGWFAMIAGVEKAVAEGF